MSLGLSVLVTPKDGPPYQELLYRGVEADGVRVCYAEGPTPSQTLNLLLAPLALGWWRARGFRLLHIHWVFQFSLPWSPRSRWARLVMEWWFRLYLGSARALGYKIIWTAHDLLPHEPVFADDVRARNLLLARSQEIIALSEATASELRALGARRVRVIPFGSYADPYPVSLTTAQARASFAFTDDDLVVALVGRLEAYKGADLLLNALAELPPSSRIKVLLAGTCPDGTYQAELQRLADRVRERVVTDFRWIPDEDLARYLQAADLTVFPFREITNSGSVLLAQSFGRPAIIADLPALSDIPSATVIRFTPGTGALLGALERAESLPTSELRAMSDAALAWSSRFDWTNIAKETIDTYRSALQG